MIECPECSSTDLVGDPTLHGDAIEIFCQWCDESFRLPLLATADKAWEFRTLVQTSLSDLLGWVGAQEWLKNEHGQEGATVEEIRQELTRVVTRIFDPDRCNDCCKGMYFCHLQRGHKHGHQYW